MEIDPRLICDQALGLLLEFFDDDIDKVHRWVLTKNALLGDITPAHMVMIGEERKLLLHIQNCIEGNRP